MSFIKFLMEQHARIQDIEDLLDDAKEHDDWEVAQMSINTTQRPNLGPMNKILTSLTNDKELIDATLAHLKGEHTPVKKHTRRVNESTHTTITPQDVRLIKMATRRGDELPHQLEDKLIQWVIEYDPTWMPYGTMKARTGDPYVWIYDHLEEIIDALENQGKPDIYK